VSNFSADTVQTVEPTAVKSVFVREGPRKIGALHLETARPCESLIEGDVVQQGSNGDDFRVILDVLHLPDASRKEP